MDERITVLDPVPVHYGWKVPSMSRRGGVRLHPINDGVMRMPHERGVQHRDQCGNKLRDVHNRLGFCTGVVSPILGGQINQGTSGSATVETRRADVTKHGQLYRDDEGRVIRTEAMGDSKLPTFKSNHGGNGTPPAPKQARSGQSSGQRKRPDMSGIPGGTGPNGQATNDDVRRFILALAKGRPVVFTPEVMKAGRKALEAKRAEAARKLRKIK